MKPRRLRRESQLSSRKVSRDFEFGSSVRIALRSVRIFCGVAIFVSTTAFSLRAQCALDQTRPFASNPCGNAVSVSTSENWRVRYFGVNAAFGALTAGISSRLRGGEFWHPLFSGALGGSLVYFGKLTVGGGAGGEAGLIGRQMGAAGASIVRNASLGKSMFEEFIVPLGPARVYLRIKDSVEAKLKVDLAGSLATIYAATRPHSHFDASASLRAGTPIFVLRRPNDGAVWQGLHIAGVVRVQDDPDLHRRLPSLDAQRRAGIIAHELVHVSQYDFSYIAWAQPGESELLRRIPGGSGISRFVDLSLNVPVWLALNALIAPEKRPWEWEAAQFSR